MSKPQPRDKDLSCCNSIKFENQDMRGSRIRNDKKGRDGMADLTGKTALVTGASGGIGAEIARKLHSAGATVGLSGTRTEPLEALAAELAERAHVLPCNLSDKDAVDALPKSAAEAMGSVDILVNNAGITRDNIFMRMSDDEWQSVIDVNLTATAKLCKGVMRGMMKARWGRIVNISSVVGATGNPGQVNYSASKAGMIGPVSYTHLTLPTILLV